MNSQPDYLLDCLLRAYYAYKDRPNPNLTRNKRGVSIHARFPTHDLRSDMAHWHQVVLVDIYVQQQPPTKIDPRKHENP